MRKKLGFVVGAMALTFVLSSCWVLQSFTIADYTLTPGQTTKARFTLRPMGSAYAPVFTGARQFVVVGVGAIGGQNTDIAVSNARWGTNGQFGGPVPMGVANGIVTSLAPGDCAQSGLDFTDISGVLWKAFATPTNKNDQGKVERRSVVEVALRAKATAVDVGENYTIMGVAGAWKDDGDGTPEPEASGDQYVCWAIVTASVHARGA
ncbi:MAG TPA: hypothetical protein VNP90_07580 [Actinomycetota bacterium]|nr:hypothetical protein [Actinomycetota bacterium]